MTSLKTFDTFCKNYWPNRQVNKDFHWSAGHLSGHGPADLWEFQALVCVFVCVRVHAHVTLCAHDVCACLCCENVCVPVVCICVGVVKCGWIKVKKKRTTSVYMLQVCSHQRIHFSLNFFFF